MDRFTNGELTAVLAAIEEFWNSASDEDVARHKEALRAARDKLEAQLKAQR